MNEDQLHTLLRAADQSAGPPPEGLRDLPDQVRKRHAKRRRRLARTRSVLALAACYGAGLLTMGAIWSASGTRGDTDLAKQSPPPAQIRSAEADATSAPDRDNPEPQQAGAILDKPPPETAPKSPYQLLVELGERSQQHNDIQAELHCYSRALEVATDEDLGVESDRDNWLLYYLKKSRGPSSSKSPKGESI